MKRSACISLVVSVAVTVLLAVVVPATSQGSWSAPGRGPASPGPWMDRWLAAPPADSLSLWEDSDHFRVHYVISGRDSIPGTAYVDSLLNALEKAYLCFRDTLGLPVAPTDGPAGGGTDLYDCQVREIGGGWLGEAWIDSCLLGSPCPHCWGRFAVDNALTWSWLRRTAAHEYFHMVQHGITLDDSWFRESTATWSERAVFPSDKRYAWAVPGSFATPDRGFSWGWGYADVHYWAFLEETQGRSFIPELWKRCCPDGWQATCDRMLRERGSSFDESLVRHALWCNATDRRDDGRHFRDAADYPLISCQARNYFYPVRAASVAEEALAVAGGSDYIRFFGPGTRDSLRIHIDGSPEARDQRRYSVVATRGRQHLESTLPPDANGDATFTVPDWPQLDYVTLIVTNFMGAAGDLHFTYDAEELGPPAPVLVTGLQCVPNPFPPARQSGCGSRAPHSPAG